MSLPPASDSSQRSNSVGVHGNQFTTGAVLATEQTRSITTAATGLKNEVENTTISYNNIFCTGNFNYSIQGATNSNRQESSEGRLATPLSPSQTTPLNNTTGLLSSPTAFQDAATSCSIFSDIHSPVPDNFNFLTRPELGGPQTWADHFEVAGKKIKDTYEDVLQKVDATRARRSGQQKRQLKRDIELQRNIFAEVTKSLITTLMTITPEQQELNDETRCLCDGACDALDSIWAQIHSLRVHVETFRTAETKDKKKKQDLAECFNLLASHTDTFEKIVVSIIPGDPIPQPPTTQMDAQDMRLELQEVERLSVEGRVSSMLHKCLCRACPEQCHDLHTAYLSLQPEDTDATPLSSPSDIARVIWQCHMAFKSTIAKDPFIWLRVVSSVVGSAESSFTETSSEVQEQSGIHSSNTTAESTENNHRKRRAASTPPEPTPKAPKLRPGQSVRRISEPAQPPSPSSRFEVCPELLAQHDLDTVVMNFTDDGGHNHNIFYLPKEKRPINDTAGDPITLSAILDKRQDRYAYGRMRNKNILRLSRLIAEAVLRFDLRDSDPSPEKCVVFYKSPQKDLAPFLKKVIRKPDHAVEAEDSSSSRRSDLLANLGHVLLQLGLMKEQRVRDDPPQDLSGRRSYIQRVAPEVQTYMGVGYHKVIQQCISLSALGGDTGGTFEEGFKQSYYHGIVKPLKDMESFLRRKSG